MKEKELMDLCCRIFQPTETIKQIISFGQSEFLSWDIDPRIGTITNDECEGNECVGLIIKLGHENYSDLILITLGFMDTYDVYFLNEEMEKTHEIKDLYFDSLFEQINNYIKKPFKVNDFCLN